MGRLRGREAGVRSRHGTKEADSITSALIGLATVLPAGAQAATTLGETSAGPIACGSGFTFSEVQHASAGSAYAVPAGGGVITSWSHFARAGAGQSLKFKVFRLQTVPDYAVVGHSSTEPLMPSQLNTFPTRIPVQAGDLLGQVIPGTSSSIGCIFSTASVTDTVGDIPSDGDDGTTASAPSPPPPSRWPPTRSRPR